MPTWLVWLIAAGVLAGGESLSGTFVLLMMSGGALAAAAAAALGGPFIVQAIVFSLITVALLAVVRPLVIHRLAPNPAVVTGPHALVGRDALVISLVTRDEGGRVRINGAEWSARVDQPGLALPEGVRARVVRIEGATAIVGLEPLSMTY